MLSIRRENFIIRPWQAEDAQSLAAEANNVKIWNNLHDSFPHPYREEDAREYIGRVSGQWPLTDFAIVVDGNAVGGIGLTPGRDVERFSAEIGYWIGESYWNRGIVTQVVNAFAEYLISSTNIVRLFALVYENNPSSARVLEKAGFRRAGILRKAAFKNNRFLNIHYYERTF
ncbi:MAG: GNAT family N-acetyltransferase [Tannerellaceae bacterium]|jgi:RimJ/RimL family protein N-acetyltransferase|nr:GNAT family N-acetyltransferase [Tannerellaceae bacterium]